MKKNEFSFDMLFGSNEEAIQYLKEMGYEKESENKYVLLDVFTATLSDDGRRLVIDMVY